MIPTVLKNLKTLPLLLTLELCESTFIWWDNYFDIYKHNLFYWDLNIKHQSSSKWDANGVEFFYAYSQMCSSQVSLLRMLNIMALSHLYLMLLFDFQQAINTIVEAQYKEAEKKHLFKIAFKNLSIVKGW